MVRGIAIVSSEHKGIHGGAVSSAGIGLMIVSVPFIIPPLTVKNHSEKNGNMKLLMTRFLF